MRHLIPTAAQLTCDSGEPWACFSRWREALQRGEALLLVDFTLERYWLEQAAPLDLTAIYFVSGENWRVAVTDRALVAQGLSPEQQYSRWVDSHQLVSFDPLSPVGLHPETIPKPWGQELWYTGVETRGVCHFACAAARTPIPWLQAVLPAAMAGAAGQPLVLLKILDPSSEPVLGDLYFELHETKREVYVVTHINRQAWPDGIGYIRYGFNQQLIEQYACDARFRDDYLAAVLAYESVRRELDDLAERGGAPDCAQLQRELMLREAMNHFTHMRPLRVGDVVQVPLRLPHALQHGVRTVEFQTPVYERKILSFGQKVLTQDHWDTRDAIVRMQLVPPAFSAPRLPEHFLAGVGTESIVDFPDFEVQRVTIPAGACWQLKADSSYRLAMVLTGALQVAGARYEAEQALLLPCLWQGLLVAAQGPEPLVFLLAMPRS